MAKTVDERETKFKRLFCHYEYDIDFSKQVHCDQVIVHSELPLGPGVTSGDFGLFRI